MKKLGLLTLVMLLALLFTACGETADDGGDVEDSGIGLLFVTETDEEGCVTENASSGYVDDQLPDGIAKLHFSLFAPAAEGATPNANQPYVDGEKLVEAEVLVRTECNDPYTCILPNGKPFKLFNVPTMQNMHLVVLAYNANNVPVWVGHNFDVDIKKDMADPNREAISVNVFMRRIGGMTNAFVDCADSGQLPIAFHTATVLRKGMSVLITGGASSVREDACSPVPSEFGQNRQCDLYIGSKMVYLLDVESGRVKALATLDRKRAGHEAVLLADGRVLIMGGADQLEVLYNRDGAAYVRANKDLIHGSAVLYNPEGTGKIEGLPNMNVPRVMFTVTPLDGDPPNATRFLVAGGWGEDSRLSSLEILSYTPGKDSPTFRSLSTAALRTPRSGHTATRLNDGRVFFYGGAQPGDSMAVAEIYMNETDGTILPEAITNFQSWPNRYYHDAVAYNNGTKVMVTGGMIKTGDASGETLSAPVASSLMIDFTSNTFAQLDLQFPRAFHKIIRTVGDRLLVVGGVNGQQMNQEIKVLEVFDGSAFSALTYKGSPIFMSLPRFAHTVSLMRDGSVAAVGGIRPVTVAGSPRAKQFIKGIEVYLPEGAISSAE